MSPFVFDAAAVGQRQPLRIISINALPVSQATFHISSRMCTKLFPLRLV